MIKDMSFGALFREIRIKNRISLRQYCIAREFDSGNISKMERNLIAPPNTKRQLLSYLHGLNYSALDYDFLLTAAVNHHISKIQGRFV